MEQSSPATTSALMLDHSDPDFASMSARETARDSLFLQAEVTVAGSPEPLIARVRNLSPGGMLAELPHQIPAGTVMQIKLPNIGMIAARCVWSGEGRFGVAFDHQIEPQAVRRRSAANQELPPMLLGQPRRAPKIRRPLRPV